MSICNGTSGYHVEAFPSFAVSASAALCWTKLVVRVCVEQSVLFPYLKYYAGIKWPNLSEQLVIENFYSVSVVPAFNDTTRNVSKIVF